MIRRGFQILVGVFVLGAAPLHASVSWPEMINVTALPTVGNIDLSGDWERSGPADGPFMYGSGPYFLYVTQDGLSVLSGVVSENSFTVAFVPGFGWQLVDGDTSLEVSGPSNFAFFGDGVFFDSDTMDLSYLVNAVTDPYLDNFPDWPSASQKIPLGFGFAMAFWAAALALHVPMKWVRSLAEAAS